MAARDVAVQLYVGGVWTTYDALAADGWKLQVGPGEQTGIRPNNLSVTLADPTGTLDPSHPESELYGIAGINTPSRLLIDGAAAVTVEASSWEPSHTPEFDPVAKRGRAWISVAGEDILRRIGKWTDLRPSSLRRMIPATTALVGYWPLEGGDRTFGPLSSALPEGHPGASTKVTFSGNPGPGGSDVCLKLEAGGSIRGNFLAYTGTDWQFIWHCELPAVPGSATDLPMMTLTDSLGRTWEMLVHDTGRRTRITDAAGTVLYNESTTFGAGQPGTGWFRWRFRATQSGGTTNVETGWYVEGNTVVYGATGSFSSPSAGRMVRWAASANAHTTGAAYSHIAGDPTAVTEWIVSGPQLVAMAGHPDEPAGRRIARMVTEAGLTCSFQGDPDVTAPMGAQRAGKTLIQHLEQCQATDGGILYGDLDSPTTVAYATRESGYLPTPVMELTKGDLATTPQRAIGDVGAANVVVCANENTGGDATYEITTGPRSTAPPPAGVGEYRDRVDVNMPDDTDLVQRAAWEAHLGTVDGARLPKLVINLGVATHLRPAAAALRPGDLITLTGVGPDTLYLRVVAYERAGNNTRDLLTLTCVPADVWTQIGTWDAATNRYDLRTCTITTAALPTATTLVLGITDDEAWSQTSAYDLVISGELVGVPAGGMSARSGAAGAYVQTITGAGRSKNGIRKTFRAGSTVRVATQGRWAL